MRGQAGPKPDPQPQGRMGVNQLTPSLLMDACAPGPPQPSAAKPITETATQDPLKRYVIEAERRALIRKASASLAARRRLHRLREQEPTSWTGFWDGKRVARGQGVVLPCGGIGHVVAIQRGQAMIIREAPFTIGEREIMLLPVTDLKRYRLPSAALLGSLKAGVKERPSETKRAACRANGCRPCRPGRKRGRPRKVTVAVAAVPRSRAGSPVA